MNSEDKHSAQGLPLVTVVLVTYNQKQYVEAAFRALVNQTYKNLEIVISDDGSPDGTGAYLQELVDAYQGDVVVRYEPNETNQGLMPNVLKVNSLARGELIVGAAGDDVSEPNRVERLVEEWLKHDRPSLMCSDAYNIDSQGNRMDSDKIWFLAPDPGMSQSDCLKSFVRYRLCSISGCTQAWTPELFSGFPPIPDNVITEDCVLTLRAWLLRGVGFVPDELVAYRLHDSNIWNVANPDVSMRHVIDTEWKRAQWEVNLMDCYVQDIEFAKDQGHVSADLAQELIGISNFHRWRYVYKRKWLDSGLGTRLCMMLGILTWNIRYWKLIKWSLQWFGRHVSPEK